MPITHTVHERPATGALMPGAGWSGATDTPGQIGSGTAADENCNLRWAIPNWQTTATTIWIEVYAAHQNGMDRVSFAVDGGTWVDVTTRTSTGETLVTTGGQVLLYRIELNAANFTDGAHEVRCIGYPTIGTPFVLQGSIGETLDMTNNDGRMSLIVNTNALDGLPNLAKYASPTGNDTTGDGSSGNPYLTIEKAATAIVTAQGTTDGGIVYVKGAIGSIGETTGGDPVLTNTNRWLTIRQWPAETAAVITGSGANGLNTKLLAFDGVKLTGAVIGSAVRAAQVKLGAMWFHDCVILGTDRFTDTLNCGINSDPYTGIKYCTGTDIATCGDSFNICQLVRNCTSDDTAAGSFRSCGAIINSVISNIDNTGFPEIHPDSLQISGTTSNMCAYGVKAVTGGSFIRLTTFEGQTTRDVVIEACQFTFEPVWEMASTNRNYFVKSTAFVGSFTVYPATTTTNVVFDTCTFSAGPPVNTGITVR